MNLVPAQTQQKLLKIPSLQNRPQNLLIPTAKESDDCLKMLQQAFPNYDVQKLVSHLYKSVFKINLQQQIDQVQKQIKQNAIVLRSRSYNDLAVYRGTIVPHPQGLQLKQKRIVAQAFIEKGNSYVYLCKKVYVVGIPQISRVQFKLLLEAVLMESYTKLQQFVQYCEKGGEITILKKRELKMLLPSLVHCQKSYGRVEGRTFLKSVGITFGARGARITGEQAKAFYVEVQQKIKLLKRKTTQETRALQINQHLTDDTNQKSMLNIDNNTPDVSHLFYQQKKKNLRKNNFGKKAFYSIVNLQLDTKQQLVKQLQNIAKCTPNNQFEHKINKIMVDNNV